MNGGGGGYYQRVNAAISSHSQNLKVVGEVSRVTVQKEQGVRDVLRRAGDIGASVRPFINAPAE